MKERIFKNWKTSIIGLVLLVVGVVGFFLDKTTLTELMAFIPFCLGFIYVKDSVLKVK